MKTQTVSREQYWKLKEARRPKKKYATPEADMQVTFFNIIRHPRNRALSPHLEFIHAIPNGGFRTPKAAAHMKAEGVLGGVSDVMIPAARHNYGGCYIENKSSVGTMSQAQKKFAEYVQTQNFQFVQCRSLDQLLDQVDSYLSIKLNRFDAPIKYARPETDHSPATAQL